MPVNLAAAWHTFTRNQFLNFLYIKEQGAVMGAQLGWAVGATTGGVILPGIGVVIGALAGWFANNLLGFAFPSCDGPVAVGLYIYNGVQLRELTKNGTYTRTDNNPGVDSAAGCGQNSDYDVTWSLSKL